MTRSRLAPSPTGAQHVGNARTYLIAWLAARSAGHKITLRIEDIDSPRVKAGAAELLETDLRWLGLDWDEGPVIQTQRLSLYEAALEDLKRKELVYPCTCSRTDVLNAASAPHAEHEGPVYPGTCAGRKAHDADSLHGLPFCWRFRMGAVEQFEDEFLGRVYAKDAAGDFVIWKTTNTPAYQLAVVVDDAQMNISHVVRGDDLIPSTPRQLSLFRALQLSPPRYAHVPLVVGTDGRRLAKRHGDTRIITLRGAGVLPENLIGWLAWSCGWVNEPKPISAKNLVNRFSWETIPKQPFVWSEENHKEISKFV